MRDVDTLVITATNRGAQVIKDQLEAIRWAFDGSFYAVIVDDAGTAGAVGDHGDHAIVKSKTTPDKAFSGFKNHEGLEHALANGISFKAALCLDDDSIIIGRGIDRWGLDRVGNGGADLLGVADRVSYQSQWERMRPLMEEWVPEALGFLPHPQTIFYCACWMSREFCEELGDRRLLIPKGYERWPSWPDVYISWMAQVLGFHTEWHGSMDKPAPPLYCNHRNTMEHSPQPWILHQDFAIYHSASAVHEVAEPSVRTYYAMRRRAEPKLAP